jgi:multidrug transporter EmrE-like cation transporter
MQYALLMSFGVLLATGQLLFKKAAIVANAGSFPWSLASGWMLTALILYAAATVLWVTILRTTPLSLAYPFAALGFVLVPAGAWYFFSEPITVRYGLGTLLIIGGIVLSQS